MRLLFNKARGRPEYLKHAATVLLVGGYAASLCAQFRADTQLVVLHATVTDKKGKLIPDLDRDAFKVFENGKQQPVKVFRHEDLPVSLGIIIDNSGSMRMKRRRVEAAALAMVRESNSDDEVFIVNFNERAYLDVPFTNNMDKMKRGLARIDAHGGTAMRDAISLSLAYMQKEATKDKKVLIVVTDGDDNASYLSLEEVVAHANRCATLIYAIGLFTEESMHRVRRARNALKELAKATGGLAIYPKNVGEVQSLGVEIAHDVRHQYTIAYTPSGQLDGSYRRVKVTVDAPGNPIVRTRAGYYAIPDVRIERQGVPALIKRIYPRAVRTAQSYELPQWSFG